MLLAANSTEFRTGLKNFLDNLENAKEDKCPNPGNPKITILGN
jgi:hypothetical protein